MRPKKPLKYLKNPKKPLKIITVDKCITSLEHCNRPRFAQPVNPSAAQKQVLYRLTVSDLDRESFRLSSIVDYR